MVTGVIFVALFASLYREEIDFKPANILNNSDFILGTLFWGKGKFYSYGYKFLRLGFSVFP